MNNLDAFRVLGPGNPFGHDLTLLLWARRTKGFEVPYPDRVTHEDYCDKKTHVGPCNCDVEMRFGDAYAPVRWMDCVEAMRERR